MLNKIITSIIILLAFIFVIISSICGPSIDSPTHLRSSDPYWYSGE